MRFILFRTPKPKQFKYKPRYFDEDKERIEQRKAELGLDSELSHSDSLRFRMRRRWKHQEESGNQNLRRFIYYAFYAFVIIGGIYVIFFTDLVENLVALFGVGR
jgi:Flp pilus assembly protein TadB